MAAAIKKISSLEVLDSRGDPTVEVAVTLSDGTVARAGVPSGASTGMFEAYELRDGDPKRYGGKGVLKACANIAGEIARELNGMDATDQKMIDETMIRLDGTANKQRLGANAILGVSLAVARAASMSEKMPLYAYLRALSGKKDSKYSLPIPLVNVINGGKHASSNLDLQEFWVIPHRAETFALRLQQGSEIFHALGTIMQKNGMGTNLGNEGGYASNFASHDQVFQFLLSAIEAAQLKAVEDVTLGIDAGSSVFFDSEKKTYDLGLEHKIFSADEFIDFWLQMAGRYPIGALEDPLGEEEWTSWQKLTLQFKKHKPEIRLIGDDLFVTNTERLQKGIDMGIANAILIKLNQIGTVTETLACINRAEEKGYARAISHRSGETTDTFIADLAVAVNAEYIKTGSTARGERTAKYNRLLEIERELHG